MTGSPGAREFMIPTLTQLIAKGESATLELKRSTGELREAVQTLCAFANGKGGRVIIGVKPSGELVGQQVSEQTFHEIAAQRDRFEPPIEFDVEAVEVAPGRSAIVLTVVGARDSVPFTFDGRAFFCQRHFPLPGKVVPSQMRRVEAPLIPPDAMREILVNALIHRDYSIAGGAVSLAIFDDRVEVWSAGKYPSGITAESLTRAHLSVQRNPIIAEVFYRTGLIEKWGRGTNRVAEMCTAAGIAPPEFEEITGAAVVTFRVPVAGPGSEPESRPESRPESASLAVRVLLSLGAVALGKAGISAALGQREISGPLNAAIRQLKADRMIELTIPDKPNSRLQKYRLTERGRAALAKGAPR